MEPIVGIVPETLQKRAPVLEELTKVRGSWFEYRKRVRGREGYILRKMRTFWSGGVSYRIEHLEKREAGKKPLRIKKLMRRDNEKFVEVDGVKQPDYVVTEDQVARGDKLLQHPFLLPFLAGDALVVAKGPMTRLESAVYSASKNNKYFVPTVEVKGGRIVGESINTPDVVLLYILLVLKVGSNPDPFKSWVEIRRLANEKLSPLLPVIKASLDPLDPTTIFLVWWLENLQMMGDWACALNKYGTSSYNIFDPLRLAASKTANRKTTLYTALSQLMYGGFSLLSHETFKALRRATATRAQSVDRIVDALLATMSGEVVITPLHGVDKYLSVVDPIRVISDVMCPILKSSQYYRVDATKSYFIMYSSEKRAELTSYDKEGKAEVPESTTMTLVYGPGRGMIALHYYPALPFVYIGLYHQGACSLPCANMNSLVKMKGPDPFPDYVSPIMRHDGAHTPYPHVFRCEDCRMTLSPFHSTRMMHNPGFRPMPGFDVTDLDRWIDPRAELFCHSGHKVSLGPIGPRTLKAPMLSSDFASKETLGDYIRRWRMGKQPGYNRCSSPNFYCWTCRKSGTMGTRDHKGFSKLSQSHDGHTVEFSDLHRPIMWVERRGYSNPKRTKSGGDGRSWYKIKMDSIRGSISRGRYDANPLDSAYLFWARGSTLVIPIRSRGRKNMRTIPYDVYEDGQKKTHHKEEVITVKRLATGVSLIPFSPFDICYSLAKMEEVLVAIAFSESDPEMRHRLSLVSKSLRASIYGQ